MAPRKKPKKRPLVDSAETAAQKPAPAVERRHWSWESRSKELLLFSFFLFYVFKLYSYLDHTVFWSDENVHAYVSQLIAKTHRLPAVLPGEIYGDFAWRYPPFFHIINAVVITLFSASALKFTNLLLLVVFVASFYCLIRVYFGHDEAAVACLLISLSPVLAMNTLRFMTELLSMVMTFFSFLYLIVALREQKTAYAIIAGVATGLLMLTKQTGFVVLSFYCLLLIAACFKRKPDIRILLIVIGTTTIVYFPYFVWATFHKIDVTGVLSLFTGSDAPAWAQESVKSFRRYDTGIEEFARLFYSGAGLVITVSGVLPLYYAIRSHLKDFTYNCTCFLVLYLAVVMIVWHITNPRHIITLLPIFTFLVAYSLYRLRVNTYVRQILLIGLFLTASHTVANLPNQRNLANPPKQLYEFTRVIRDDPDAPGRVLTIQQFDIHMYTKKPVIWPSASQRDCPVDLFAEQSADELYQRFKKYNISYIFIDLSHMTVDGEFNGRNFPISFIQNCETLNKSKRLTLKKMDNKVGLLLLKVPSRELK